jgi:hypothetical protein
MNRLLSASLVSAFAWLVSAPAAATDLYDPTVSTTTTLNGSSIVLSGTLNDTNGNPEPWTAELFADVGECVRLFVSSSDFTAQLTVLSPDGSANRDSNIGGTHRPLVRIASAPVRGWYTVHVSQQSGFPTIGNFTLKYGRYNAGNPNCNGAPGPIFDPTGTQAALK